jgi:thymidylate kinase
MKLIILEGGDRLGKSTIIEGLCKYFNYDNVTIRHFGKPPKSLIPEEVLKFQFRAFNKELDLFYHINAGEYDKYTYYPEIMIWNRSHLGEYVYSQMFRNGNPEVLKNMLFEYERGFISHKVYLITLTADPEFFLSKEDGNSFSNKLEDKTKELQLFKEAHDFSILSNKLYLKVDKTSELQTGTEWRMKGPNIFRSKEEILNEVIEFIK